MRLADRMKACAVGEVDDLVDELPVPRIKCQVGPGGQCAGPGGFQWVDRNNWCCTNHAEQLHGVIAEPAQAPYCCGFSRSHLVLQL
jgi:hypothetical protein